MHHPTKAALKLFDATGLGEIHKYCCPNELMPLHPVESQPASGTLTSSSGLGDKGP